MRPQLVHIFVLLNIVFLSSQQKEEKEEERKEERQKRDEPKIFYDDPYREFRVSPASPITVSRIAPAPNSFGTQSFYEERRRTGSEGCNCLPRHSCVTTAFPRNMKGCSLRNGDRGVCCTGPEHPVEYNSINQNQITHNQIIHSPISQPRNNLNHVDENQLNQIRSGHPSDTQASQRKHTTSPNNLNNPPNVHGEIGGCNCLPRYNCQRGYGQLGTSCLSVTGSNGVCCLQQDGIVLRPVGFQKTNFTQHPIPDHIIVQGYEEGQRVHSRRMFLDKERLRNQDYLGRDDPARGHAFNFERRLSSMEISNLAFTIAQASVQIAKSQSMTPDEAYYGLSTSYVGPSHMGFQCPLNQAPICDPHAPFRTIDGTCNNLQWPLIGRSDSGFARLGPALYNDGIIEPRKYGVDGYPLPNARDISNLVLLDVDVPNPNYTLSLMQWGQFIDHDMAHTPFAALENKEGIRCCDADGNVVQPMPMFCIPILVTPKDEFYGPRGQKCINLVRSLFALNDNCGLGPAEQLNSVTHWIDGSAIYGSTPAEKLRAVDETTGFMRTSANNLLPTNNSFDCAPRNPEFSCFISGDSRVNQHPGLTVMTTLWMREHNRIAYILKDLNPYWDAARLFKEAKRIMAAEIQHINYNEYLPILLGDDLMKHYGLNTLKYGYRSSYDPYFDPRIINEFTTGVFRLGHSMAQSFFRATSITGKESILLLRDSFNAPHLLQQDPELMEGIVNSFTLQDTQDVDTLVAQDMSNHVFQSAKANFGLDLKSLNIQRGRDHAISTYNLMRERYGGGRAKDFLDLLSTTSEAVIKRMQSVYRHPDDIDLFVGGLAEKHLPDSLVGPTFGNIVGLQFQAIMNGDRFFYDMGGQTGSFTPEQLQEIRKVTLARVYCDNTRVPEMQLDAFEPVSVENPRVTCNNIPSINYNVFKEYHH